MMSAFTLSFGIWIVLHGYFIKLCSPASNPNIPRMYNFKNNCIKSSEMSESYNSCPIIFLAGSFCYDDPACGTFSLILQ